MRTICSVCFHSQIVLGLVVGCVFKKIITRYFNFYVNVRI